MQTKPTVTFLFFILAGLGSWGIWKIALSNGLLANLDKKTHIETNESAPLPNNSNVLARENVDKKPNDDFLSLSNKIKQYLKRGQIEHAIEQVNDQYSQLSIDQLDSLKQLFIHQGLSYSDNGQPNKAQRLYSQLSELFNDTDILDLLSSTSIKLKDWQSAFDALLSSSLLESRPDALIKKQLALANVAAQLKQTFQASNDLASIQRLYQQLYETHPSYSYFQFELAMAQLSLGNTVNAKTLLSAIQYDLDIGSSAQEQLALINKQEQAEQKSIEQKSKLENSPNTVVPLTRVGNSFLINSKINGRETRLLLDTGASITALSANLIDQLNLPATGEVIRLSTANGVTQSQLFLAKRIQLGRVTAQNLVVAEIELGSNDQFQGLLGTDLLNQINKNYLIDNQNNKLIFRW